MKSQLKYLTHQQIDKEKWDACLDLSYNTIIYGYSFYLDGMAGTWDALVLNDYEAVMPLTWRRKWLIRYLYQPAFTQQLGIFSPKKISAELIELFMSAVTGHFSFAEIFLNTENAIPGLLPRTNFILPLQDTRSRYSKNAVKNIRRAEKFGLQYAVLNDVHKAVMFFKAAYSTRIKSISNTDYKSFEQLCLFAQKNKLLVLREIIDQQGNLLATALLLLKKNRLYLLQSTTLAEGRKQEANYFLLDNLIKEFSNKDILLDFEGSDIADIAYFYQGFGAVREPYYFYRHSRLPWPLSLFK